MTKSSWIFGGIIGTLGFGALTVLGLRIANVCCPRPQRALASSEAATASVALSIEGMDCSACTAAIRTALKQLDGVRDARIFSFVEKRAVVEYEPARVAPEQLVEAVNRLGYRAILAPAGS
jgi:Cu+-exporting ATPase